MLLGFARRDPASEKQQGLCAIGVEQGPHSGNTLRRYRRRIKFCGIKGPVNDGDALFRRSIARADQVRHVVAIRRSPYRSGP